MKQFSIPWFPCDRKRSRQIEQPGNEVSGRTSTGVIYSPPTPIIRSFLLIHGSKTVPHGTCLHSDLRFPWTVRRGTGMEQKASHRNSHRSDYWILTWTATRFMAQSGSSGRKIEQTLLMKDLKLAKTCFIKNSDWGICRKLNKTLTIWKKKSMTTQYTATET